MSNCSTCASRLTDQLTRSVDGQRSPLIAAENTLTRVFRETYRQGRLPDLLLEQIFLVEEENDGGVREPFIVANGVEQFQTFLHSIL